MATARIDPQLAQLIMPIWANQQNQTFQLTITLTSTVDPTFSFKIPIINECFVDQNFVDNTFDWWEVVTNLQTADYLKVVAQYQGLQATVQLDRKNQVTGKLEELIFRTTYLAIITSPVDLGLASPVTQTVNLDPTKIASTAGDQITTYEMILQFYEPSTIQIRKYGYNFVLRNVTIQTTIELLASLCNLSRVEIVPPDNTKVYEQLVMPGPSDLRIALRYLQDAPYLGVYETGHAFYCRDNTLYVYPAYDVTPDRPELPVTVFLVPNWNASAGTSHHYLDSNGQLSLVTSGPLHPDETTRVGLEKFGTAAYLLHNGDICQATSRIRKNDQLVVSEKLLEIIEITTQRGIIPNTHTPVYYEDGGNRYRCTTELARSKAVTLYATWTLATPFLIKPGQRVQCVHVSAEKRSDGTTGWQVLQHTIRGICQRVCYDFIREKRSIGECFYCRATLVLRLEDGE